MRHHYSSYRKRSLSQLAIGMVALGGSLALGGCQASGSEQPVPLTTTYQAVALDNGQVYFGRIQGLNSPYPVLTDVYYVQARVNPKTKKTTNILVKQGKEWHAPDRMVLNARHIVFIEPVTAESQVAKLIEEATKK